LDSGISEKDFAETIGAVFKLAAGSLGRVLLWFGLPVLVWNLLLLGSALLVDHHSTLTEDGMLPWIMLGMIPPMIWLSAAPLFLIDWFSGRYQGIDEPGMLGASFRRVLKKFLPLLGTGVVAGLALVAGYALLIVPGVILSLGWFCMYQAVLLEDLSVDKAMVRSWRLTKGSRLEILGHCMIFGLIRQMASLILTLPVYVVLILILISVNEDAATKWLLFSVYPISELIAVPLLPLFPALSTVVWYNLRIRKEGLISDTLRRQFDSVPEGAEL
jgi:hypothetical protein